MSDSVPSKKWSTAELAEFLEEAIKAEPGKCIQLHRSWAVRILDALKPPLAGLAPEPIDSRGIVREPFVVKHYAGDERPSIKGNGFDGLEIGEDRQEAEEFVAWINARLAPPPVPAHDLDVHSVANNDPRRKRCFEGECARTACTNRPAVYFNKSTRWYYCGDCARKINQYAQEELCAIVAGGAEALVRAGLTKGVAP